MHSAQMLVNKPICKLAGLPRPGPLSLCILKAHEVATKGVNRLSHAIYYCLAGLCGLSSQFAKGLHFSAFQFLKSLDLEF